MQREGAALDARDLEDVGYHAPEALRLRGQLAGVAFPVDRVLLLGDQVAVETQRRQRCAQLVRGGGGEPRAVGGQLLRAPQRPDHAEDHAHQQAGDADEHPQEAPLLRAREAANSGGQPHAPAGTVDRGPLAAVDHGAVDGASIREPR